MAQIDELLRYLKTNKGSDLHLAAGLEPRVRVNGELRAVAGQAKLSDDSLRKLLQEITSPAQWEAYTTGGDLDFAYGLEGVARFRVNYFVQENGAGAVCRMIPEKIVRESSMSAFLKSRFEREFPARWD